MKTKHLD